MAAPEALDGDAILGTQAQARFVAAHDWREIGPAVEGDEEEDATT